MAIKYNANGKIIPHKFSLRRLERAAEEYAGFCIACGSEHEAIDPDARRYTCEECGKNHVYGAEELVMMGFIKGAQRESA